MSAEPRYAVAARISDGERAMGAALEAAQHLYPLYRDEAPALETEPSLFSVRWGSDGRRYLCVEAVVDSGAEETVAPVGLFPGTARSSPMSRAGRFYRAANGGRIPEPGRAGRPVRDR